jgi:hypothetical protein
LNNTLQDGPNASSARGIAGLNQSFLTDRSTRAVARMVSGSHRGRLARPARVIRVELDNKKLQNALT